MLSCGALERSYNPYIESIVEPFKNVLCFKCIIYF